VDLGIDAFFLRVSEKKLYNALCEPYLRRESNEELISRVREP
jgi:hypothetical protein